ncbi:BED-type domain-containing protein [Citrus sinensis]|nr:BED-type domain-containing protein [Citrus sinensis]
MPLVSTVISHRSSSPPSLDSSSSSSACHGFIHRACATRCNFQSIELQSADSAPSLTLVHRQPHLPHAITVAGLAKLLSRTQEPVFAVTVDNVSANEGAVRYLKDRLSTWRDDSLVLNGDYMHVCCCAHILNLIVNEGLKEMDASIVSVRNAMKYVRSSTARMQAFQICVNQEKINCKGSVILDCPTRWNSTYMLSTALKFKSAFDRMANEYKFYDAYFREKENGEKKRIGPPLNSDWESARRICKFLKTFYDATLQFSSSLKLTLNLCYNLICQIESTLKSLCKSNDSDLSAMATKMKDKFDKYWEGTIKINKMLIVACVLDPRGKMKFATHCFEELYGQDSGKCSEMKEMVKDLFVKLFESYSARYSKPSGVGSASASKSASASQHFGSGCGDVIVVPVSTVASESAFSTGGSILDQYRSSLTPDMVEALILTQNWLRSSLFLDATTNLNQLVQENEFMDQLSEEFRKSTTADHFGFGVLH